MAHSAPALTPSGPSDASGADAFTRVTHPDRVIDSVSGITKGMLVAYYERVAPLMLPHLRARPVALVRAPAGVNGPQFFQKHAGETPLPGVKQLAESLDPGHEPLLCISSEKGLLSAAQMNVIEFHTWNTTTRSSPRPDRMLFDLDPGSGVSWPSMCEAAHLLRARLADVGLESFVKTSGGKGLHVVVPLVPRADFEVVRQFSHRIVSRLANEFAGRFVAKSGARNRVGKIFVDYLRNNWGATTASAWSARSRPGLGVSVPIDWSELDSTRSGAHWNVANIEARLARGNEPWTAYATTRQGLSKAMKSAAFEALDRAEEFE
jgi:bifunctional non-homologous end joining protein LigD